MSYVRLLDTTHIKCVPIQRPPPLKCTASSEIVFGELKMNVAVRFTTVSLHVPAPSLA